MSNILTITFNFFWKKKYVTLFVGIFLLVLTQRFLNERQHGLTDSIASDGLGYYSYLPAAIIYHDFSYKFYNNPTNYIKPIYHTYFNQYKDKLINKYYCGTAICFLPFFLLGIVISAIAGTDINGYTDTFLMLISVCSIIYFLFSVYFISKIADFFKLSQKISLLMCLIYFFGTNLFHYVIQEPSMSHVYSFFAISLFFYLYTKLLSQISNKNLIFVALSLSLIALIRPPNVIVVLFLPFFSENLRAFWLFLKKIFSENWLGFIYSIIIVCSAIFLQFYFYFLQTGEFFILTYDGETFNFSNPEFFNTFFSYKKGLVLYTPLFLGSLFFIVLVIGNWYKKIVFFITLFVFSYITSSWWCWWYGGGFSIRPFVDILPLFIIITMFLFDKLKMSSRKFVFFACIPFLLFNQLKSFQYANLLISTQSMNEEMYWDVFIETNLNAVNNKKINKILKKGNLFKADSLDFESSSGYNSIAFGGYKSNRCCVVGKDNNYSKGLDFIVKVSHPPSHFYLIAECLVKTIDDDKDLTLVISETINGNIMRYEASIKCQFDELDNGWTRISKIIEVNNPDINSVFSIFAYSSVGKSYIDDLKYTVIGK